MTKGSGGNGIPGNVAFWLNRGQGISIGSDVTGGIVLPGVIVFITGDVGFFVGVCVGESVNAGLCVFVGVRVG